MPAIVLLLYQRDIAGSSLGSRCMVALSGKAGNVTNTPPWQKSFMTHRMRGDFTSIRRLILAACHRAFTVLQLQHYSTDIMAIAQSRSGGPSIALKRFGSNAAASPSTADIELLPLQSDIAQPARLASGHGKHSFDGPAGVVISVPQGPDIAFAPTVGVDDVVQPGREIQVSKTRGVLVIVTLAGISFLNTMGSGILIAALPRIGREVNLPPALVLWPAAVFALSAGCLLLIFGAAADAIGAKTVWVVGSYLFVVFTIALGFAKTGLQVIMFRMLLGVAISMCLPTAVSLITNTFPKGPWRNVAFAMNGMGQPLGYAIGLVLGGIFTDTIGWRWA